MIASLSHSPLYSQISQENQKILYTLISDKNIWLVIYKHLPKIDQDSLIMSCSFFYEISKGARRWVQLHPHATDLTILELSKRGFGGVVLLTLGKNHAVTIGTLSELISRAVFPCLQHLIVPTEPFNKFGVIDTVDYFANPLFFPAIATVNGKSIGHAVPDTSLHFYAKNGDIKAVKKLLVLGFTTVLVVDESTPLGMALDRQNWKMVKAMAKADLSRGCEMSHYGRALELAYSFKQRDLLMLLLQTDARKQCRYHKLIHESRELLDYIIPYIDLSQEDQNGLNIIEAAVKGGEWSVVARIAATRATDRMDNGSYCYALRNAPLDGLDTTVETLVEAIARAGVRENKQLYPALETMAFRGCQESVLRLLESADLAAIFKDWKGTVLLRYAINCEHSELLQRLLPLADLAPNDGYFPPDVAPIVYAAKNDKFRSVKLIAEIRPTDSEDRAEYSHALCLAVRRNEVEAARALIKAGAQEVCQRRATSAIHDAIERDYSEMVRTLLPICDLTRVDLESDLTPIESAAILKRWAIVVQIANAKATDTEDSARYTRAFTLAMAAHEYTAAVALLHAGTRIPPHLPIGSALLHIAIETHDMALFRMVLPTSDILGRNHIGLTPLERAITFERRDMIRAIQEKASELLKRQLEMAGEFQRQHKRTRTTE